MKNTNKNQSVGRLTKTKQDQMFNGYYDTLANYFGGDEVQSIINKVSQGDRVTSISFMRSCVSQLEKLNQKGYWCNLSVDGVTN
jgi:hypothetical protein